MTAKATHKKKTDECAWRPLPIPEQAKPSGLDVPGAHATRRRGTGRPSLAAPWLFEVSVTTIGGGRRRRRRVLAGKAVPAHASVLLTVLP